MGIPLLPPKNKGKKNILAVILCAGKGTRLNEHSNKIKIPKPLIKIENESILEILINTLYLHKIERIILVKGYLGHEIENFAIRFRTDQKIPSAHLSVIDAGEDYKLGPLHSFLSITKDQSFFFDTHYFLIVPGDIILESGLLSEVLKKIDETSYTNPIIFYQDLKPITLRHRIISIAQDQEKEGIKVLKKIVQLDLKNLSDFSTIQQVIPIFFVDYSFIKKISHVETIKSFKTIREIINFLIIKGEIVNLVRVNEKFTFYDIDYKSDIEYYLNYHALKGLDS